MMDLRKCSPKAAENGALEIVAEIDVSFATELVGMTEIEGMTIANGSSAWAIEEGETYGYCGGSWFRQSDGSEVTE